MESYKFRAKRTDNGEWYYWGLTGTTTQVDMKTVGQFTGLLDKNGTEIYEGDKVKCPVGISEVVFGCYVMSTDDWGVEHKTVGFVRKWLDGSGYSELDNDDELEVIGTIFDTPDQSKKEE